MKTKSTILIGSAGTGTAFGAITALRRTWGHSVKVIAMDINPRHLVTSSILADDFEQIPLSSSTEFPAVLSDLIKHHEVDTYLPLLPEEILIAAELSEKRLLGESVTVIAPTRAASVECADKLSLSNLLVANEIPVPLSAPASDAFAAGKYFLKPKNGTGSKGSRIVDAHDLAITISENPGQWLVQEVCDGPEVTVDVFYDPHFDYLHVICRERIEVKSGVSTKCRLFQDPNLSHLAKSIANLLSLKGSFCFQVMRTRGSWVVIDVNPRPGASTAMCTLSGNDFFSATFALQWKESYFRFFRSLDDELFVTRQYCEFLM
jgi:carbamoylphosphate synthase large subunit